MKNSRFVLLFFSALPLLYAAPSDEAEKQPEKPADEVALLESSVFTNPPMEPAKVAAPPPMEKPSRKSSFTAVGLSFLAPGLGNMYLGDYKSGGGLLSTYAVGLGLETTGSYGSSLAIAQNTSFYGIYAAYRDVRIYNNEFGYAYKMPTDSLADLTRAPFRWRILKKTEVWGGVLGLLSAGSLLGYYAFPQEVYIKADATEKKDRLHNPLAAFPVGLGEEAFFRGYLQPFLTERTSPVGGIMLSSIIFGAMHAGNARFLEPEQQWRYYAFSIPYISSIGAYLGWLTHKNTSLQESVAVHAWYDFVLFSAGALATEAAIGGKPTFSTSFTF